MKISKVLCSTFIFTVVMSFTGCFWMWDMPSGYGYKNKEIDLTGKLNDKSQLYLVQANIPYDENGKLLSPDLGSVQAGAALTNKERFAEEESEINSNPDLLKKNLIDIKPDFVKDGYNFKPDFSTGRSVERALNRYDDPVDWDTVKRGSTVKFWIQHNETDEKGNSNSYQILEDTTCKYIGEHCRIFYFNNSSYTKKFGTPELEEFNKLGKKFDIIYEAETTLLGTTRNNKTNTFSDRENLISYFINMNSNDKINIVVYDCFEDASENQQSGVIGYFFPIDLYTQDLLDYSRNGLYSNETEVFYIDSYFLQKIPDTVYSTLAHEFCHMLNFITKMVNCKDNVWETWFTEMLAMNTEDLLAEILEPEAATRTIYQNRIPFFNFFPSNGMIWKNGEGTSADYSYTFALGAYLIRNFGGVDLFYEMANSDKTGWDAVNSALAKFNDKIDGRDITAADCIANFYEVFLNTGVPKDIDELTLRRSGIKNIDGHDYSYDVIKLNTESFRWATQEQIQNNDDLYKLQKEDKLGSHTGLGLNMYGANYSVNIGPYGFSLQNIQKGNDYSVFNFKRSAKSSEVFSYITDFPNGKAYELEFNE